MTADRLATATDLLHDQPGAPVKHERVLGRYVVGAVLGAGGMGTVYRARDPQLNRDVAIKVVPLRDHARDHARVMREAEAMAKLRHRNVVPVFDVGSVDGAVFLVMPLLEGGTLRGWIEAERRPWREVVARFLDAARGLQAAHAVGVVHRDFKPDNVLIGQVDEVQVSDFGLARTSRAPDADGKPASAFDATLTHEGAVIGTLAYMAPEQLDGRELDARADQFSFCVALYEAIHGCRPYEVAEQVDDRVGALRLQLRDASAAALRGASPLPQPLRLAIARGLDVEPGARFDSMTELIAALDRGRRRASRGAVVVGGITAIAIAGAVALLATSADPVAPAAPTSPRRDVAWEGRTLTTGGDATCAELSPDGRQLLVVSRAQVLILSTTDGHVRTLMPADLSYQCPRWSGRPGRVTYTHRTGPKSLEGVSRNVEDGSEIRTPHAAADWIELPDGSQLEYAQDGYLRTSDSSGKRLHQCKLSKGNVNIRLPQLVGSTVYFQTYEESMTRVIAVDTNCQSRVVLPPRALYAVRVREDGKLVAQVSRAARHYLEVYEPGGALVETRELPGPTYKLETTHTAVGEVFVQTTMTWRLFDLTNPSVDLRRGTVAELFIPSPDGQFVAALEDDSPEAVMVKEMRDLYAQPAPIAHGVSSLAWRSDGKLAILQFDGSTDRDILRLIDPGSGTSTTGERLGIGKGEPLVWLDDRRLAHKPNGDRGYAWVDVVDLRTGRVVDDEAGYLNGLSVSPRHSTFAFHRGNGRLESGTYIVEGDRERIVWSDDRDGGFQQHVWTADGRALLLFNAPSGEIRRYDVETHTIALTDTLALSRGVEVIAGLYPLPDRTLAKTTLRLSDLVLFPAR